MHNTSISHRSNIAKSVICCRVPRSCVFDSRVVGSGFFIDESTTVVCKHQQASRVWVDYSQILRTLLWLRNPFRYGAWLEWSDCATLQIQFVRWLEQWKARDDISINMPCESMPVSIGEAAEFMHPRLVTLLDRFPIVLLQGRTHSSFDQKGTFLEESTTAIHNAVLQ